jgi:hypothetical protein
MKRIITTFLFGVACLIATSNANALPTQKATIPFDFTVGQLSVPAGTYVISQVSPEVIELDSSTRSIHLRVGVIPADWVSQRPDKLVFHKYGDRCFLSELRGGMGEFVSTLRPSRLEKNLRLEQAAAADQQITEIALK